ncbi:hypothetical protein [Cellulosimicrobium funkei]|uniref:hypothetical protein n=1 Tax=Cellulosimicrobium funkei TaxID=264251 RepID=UPI0037DCA992
MTFCPQTVVWGTVGEWFAAVFVAVPVFFWLVERRERRATQRKLDDRQRFEDDERLVYQAARTAFWATEPKTYLVRNYSDLPLRDVYLVRRVPSSDGSGLYERHVAHEWPIVPPMEDFPVRDKTAGRGGSLVLEFTDSRGTTWERHEDGALKRVHMTLLPTEDAAGG